MAVATETAELSPKENFAALLDETMGGANSLEGTVVKGRVISIENDAALIDVGLKSEGRVALKEFAAGNNEPEIHVGDIVEVFLERMEDKNGEASLSREKARREEAWTQLEKSFQANERVTGMIFGRVKGGFTVDLNGAVAFLPGSQVDIRPVRDIAPLLGSPQPFQILKMDRSRGNIVVSRRAVLEESRAEQRSELVASLKEGQILSGVVKNITDYGAFVDLGGVDGLLHVTDIAWRRINHPSEALNIGQTVKVQVIRFNPETQRISLGMKQLEADPWEGVELKYPAAARFKGRVTNITDYGAFVELEPGVEGLVHVSEMSWTKKNVHPGKIVSTSQEVEVMVLDVDPQKRRISLGLKQTLANPWEAFIEEHPAGGTVEGEVRNITEFGLFIGLPGDIDGMVHLSDIDWNRAGEDAAHDYRKGQVVKVKVLDVDVEKERISLGIKQLEADPFEQGMTKLKKGEVVTGTISGTTDTGVEITLADGVPGFIRKSELSRDRSEQRPDRFAVGERIDAKVTAIDRATRRVTLSIKAREVDEEKRAMAEFGSSDSGASLGDILGAAIRRRQGESEDKGEAEDKGETEDKGEAEETAEDKG
jgi:small subunit ribosomal protein S1